MRQRYCNSMTDIAPSPEFLRRLEQDMNRELNARPTKAPLYAAAAAALIVLTLAGARMLRPHPDVVQRSSPPGPLSQPSATAAPTSAPTSAPTATPSPTTTLVPDDIRLELEMSEKEVVFRSQWLDESSTEQLVVFENNLVGAFNSSPIEIHESSDPASPVRATLLPGTAHWPIDPEDNGIENLPGEEDIANGYAQRTVWLDEERNVLRDGYIIIDHNANPLSEVDENPVEELHIPGKANGEAVLRYGRYENAPAVATLEDGQLIGLGYRVGNWIYASTEFFVLSGEKPVTGWVHVSQAKGCSWAATVTSVELLGDKVNVRAKPDENSKILATLPRDFRNIYYTGVTQTTKSGRWHLVRFGGSAKTDGFATGFISADYVSLAACPLASLVDLENVASATLAYGENAPFGRTSQTIEGERLSLLKERLYGALSVSTYESVCGEGTATLTLSYPDGTQEILPISGDGCTHLRCGDVKYDLRTEEERAYAWQNDGGAGMSDILSPIFDEIKIP